MMISQNAHVIRSLNKIRKFTVVVLLKVRPPLYENLKFLPDGRDCGSSLLFYFANI